MNKINDNIVDISYQQTGKSSNTNELGMREMQAKAYEARNHRFLLIKAPPASGKSRALMFIALDKLMNQGIKKVVVAVPEKSIGRSFQDTDLMKFGFFADWRVNSITFVILPTRKRRQYALRISSIKIKTISWFAPMPLSETA